MWSDGFSLGNSSGRVSQESESKQSSLHHLVCHQVRSRCQVGRVSAISGWPVSFTDHSCQRGPQLPLWSLNLPQPGSSICPSPRKPINSTFSSANPDSRPGDDGDRTRLCVTISKCSSGTQDSTALSTQGLISTEQWSLGTHQLSQTNTVKCP